MRRSLLIALLLALGLASQAGAKEQQRPFVTTAKGSHALNFRYSTHEECTQIPVDPTATSPQPSGFCKITHSDGKALARPEPLAKARLGETVRLTLDRRYDSVTVSVRPYGPERHRRTFELGAGHKLRWRVTVPGTYYESFVLKWAAETEAQSATYEATYSLHLRVQSKS
jgi:hypothetical protein